jgi:carbamoyltransferase
MAKPTYVLGTSLSHDGSACLLKNGELCVAIEKERVTRVKHDGYNDTAAIEYCLHAAGISMTDISLVVQNTWEGMFERGNHWFRGPRILDPGIPVVTISHHLAHAYSAFATSPFEEANILVLDNGGNSLDECIDLEGATIPVRPAPELRPLYSEVDSYYSLAHGDLRTIYKDFSPPGIMRKPYFMFPRPMMHSIGGLYLAVSVYIFRGMDDPGKLMGLAPYGRPGVYDFPMFDLRDNRVFVRYDWQQRFNSPCGDQEQFKAGFQYYADIAWWTQKEVERAILYLVQSRFNAKGGRNLCYSGGVALNAVANRRILVDGPFEKVYIQPAAGDNGVSIGCAYYGWLTELKRERVMHGGSTYFGMGYQDEDVDAAVVKANASHLVQQTQDHIGCAAELLAKGKVVAWFQGGAEFGPRSLGNRSILADPRRPGVREFINKGIKNREDFRPFAPSVLIEDTQIYFDCDFESPHMILVALVLPQWRKVLSSVVHLDNTSRIHTVVQEMNPSYYRLLQNFKELTGIGVLLNTSLNKRGMPIVETPYEALALFLHSELDALILNGRLLCKSPRNR